ncbi:unknown [[Mannheimia] succiniciproducens MBEL55E]|uniref:Uncharacterized protein n=1 Tax=Mannheimia succiniciproducens (strain KCTC 0769BP / MBEL55E) TaxID=221988 RepID=Q65TJ7_MANSM|nr:unknown [[Mannheimia] succiniciproducens MBEL55E]
MRICKNISLRQKTSQKSAVKFQEFSPHFYQTQ